MTDMLKFILYMGDFGLEAAEYDRWYDEHRAVYLSELRAIRAALPKRGCGLEIGAGTGRFSAALGIRTGVEPSAAMAALARSRGLEICEARAERLPFADASFGFALMATALCFVKRPLAALKEAVRVIKPGGRLVLAIIDGDSPAGRKYWGKKAGRRFYREARILGASGVMARLEELGLAKIRSFQTLSSQPEDVRRPEPVRAGHGEGLFAVIAATKAKRRVPRAGAGTTRGPK